MKLIKNVETNGQLFQNYYLAGKKLYYINRTDNSIKNHFYSTLRRSLRRINKHVGDKNSNLIQLIILRYCLN